MSKETALQTWEMICGNCQTDGAVGERVYGVSVRMGDCRWLFEDVNASAERVQVLLKRLRAGQPAPCHWEDIIRDFIESDGV